MYPGCSCNYERNMYSNIYITVFMLGVATAVIIESDGYLVYCPCMGRFGNQADHFLGVLAFSKGLNRTLVLPPWVEYRYGKPRSIQVPFDTYFNVEKINEHHRVITMENFMKSIAPKIWPTDKRISFCYTKRMGELEDSCNAKSGNPFGPFWDTFDIEFVKSEFYGPLNYDAHNVVMMDKWKQKYPSEKWPVLAFTGAPASFPVQDGNQILQKFLRWSDNIFSKAKTFIKKNFNGGGFVGIHLRNGQDWVKACQHVKDSPLLFAAPQCVGYRNEKGPLTFSMCLPDKGEIIKQVKRAVKKIEGIKYIFVASDSNLMVDDLTTALQYSGIQVVTHQPSNPHIDLAILGQANYFIGNCVSSFTAFAKRERDVRGLPSEFWSFPAHYSPLLYPGTRYAILALAEDTSSCDPVTGDSTSSATAFGLGLAGVIIGCLLLVLAAVVLVMHSRRNRQKQTKAELPTTTVIPNSTNNITEKNDGAPVLAGVDAEQKLIKTKAPVIKEGPANNELTPVNQKDNEEDFL